MENEPLTILGQTNYRNEGRRFGIKPADRRRHTYVVGKTGMGKSTLLLNCIVQDIQRGYGVAVLDPHGDLVERVLDYIPPRRINETVYFNPADTEYPIAFNPLRAAGDAPRHLVASGLVQVFKKVWHEFWGPRLEYVLRNAFLALLETQNQSLLGVPRLLVDDRFRAQIVARLTDPVVRQFWIQEFEQYPKVFRTETISPIQNKVGQFLATPMLRNILGQVRNKLSMGEVLRDGKILLVNLAKGSIGEDASSLLGALVVTQLYLAALRRVSIPESQRGDFFVYIDELQSVTTEDFPTMLAEGRKYGLCIAGMANQFLGQLPSSLRESVLGNVGTVIVFAVGAEDAKALEAEFQPPFSATDLLYLPMFHIYVKLSIGGRTSEPFSATTIPVRSPQHGMKERIVRQSRQRYTTPRRRVERGHTHW